MILTDATGRPLPPKPELSDYPDTTSYLRACYEWRDAVADMANQAFAVQFSKSIRGSK